MRPPVNELDSVVFTIADAHISNDSLIITYQFENLSSHNIFAFKIKINEDDCLFSLLDFTLLLDNQKNLTYRFFCDHPPIWTSEIDDYFVLLKPNEISQDTIAIDLSGHFEKLDGQYEVEIRYQLPYDFLSDIELEHVYVPLLLHLKKKVYLK